MFKGKTSKVMKAIAAVSKAVDNRYSYLPVSETPTVIFVNITSKKHYSAFHVCNVKKYCRDVGKVGTDVKCGWLLKSDNSCESCNKVMPGHIIFKILMITNMNKLRL